MKKKRKNTKNKIRSQLTLQLGEGRRASVYERGLEVFQRRLVVALDLEHQPQAQMDFIGSAEPGINVQHLLECFDGPAEEKEDAIRGIIKVIQTRP